MLLERMSLPMATAEGLPYFVMAAMLVAILLTKVRTKWERVAAAAMVGSLIVGGLDAIVDGTPTGLAIAVMILGLGVAVLSVVIDYLNRTPT